MLNINYVKIPLHKYLLDLVEDSFELKHLNTKFEDVSTQIITFNDLLNENKSYILQEDNHTRLNDLKQNYFVILEWEDDNIELVSSGKINGLEIFGIDWFKTIPNKYRLWNNDKLLFTGKTLEECKTQADKLLYGKED